MSELKDDTKDEETKAEVDDIEAPEINNDNLLNITETNPESIV